MFLVGEIATYHFGITDRLRFKFLGHIAFSLMVVSAILRWLYITIMGVFKRKKEGDI